MADPLRDVPRDRRRRELGQNFLVDRTVVARLVDAAAVERDDLVLDIGAGRGYIAQALAATGASVVAIERDPDLASALEQRFADRPDLRVVQADARRFELPERPFRVVANLPFSVTTDVLRHVLRPEGQLSGADVIVQLEVARKRASARKGNVLNMTWRPWFTFEFGWRIPSEAFRPRPRTDAGVLHVRRRPQPLLPAERSEAYGEFVRAGFTGSGPSVRRSLGRSYDRQAVAAALSRLDIGRDATPPDLHVEDWAALFTALQQAPAARRPPRRRPLRR